MLINEDETLLCELQTVVRLEALNLAAGQTLPRPKMQNAMR